jgi:glutathione peroxidase
MFYTTILFFNLIFFIAPQKDNVPQSIYDFKVAALTGGNIDFSDFKGKKILIVNTASKCGFTPQYEQLEALYQKYADRLVIIGFPANNFLWQEPGSNEDIANFCQKNYGVTFPMAAKISVKGKNVSPVYQWLTKKAYNHFQNSSVKWNFQKYLIDENGNLIAIFPPSTRPDNAAIIRAIEAAATENLKF